MGACAPGQSPRSDSWVVSPEIEIWLACWSIGVEQPDGKALGSSVLPGAERLITDQKLGSFQLDVVTLKTAMCRYSRCDELSADTIQNWSKETDTVKPELTNTLAVL